MYSKLGRLRYLPDPILNAAISIVGQSARFATDIARLRSAEPTIVIACGNRQMETESRAFTIAQHLQQTTPLNVVTLLSRYSNLREMYLEKGPTYCLHGATCRQNPCFEFRIDEFVRLSGDLDIIAVLAFDIRSADMLSNLQRLSAPIHAIETSIVDEFPREKLSALDEFCETVTFPSELARLRAMENTQMNPGRLEVATPGVVVESAPTDDSNETRFVVVGTGSCNLQCGFDTFIATAITTLNMIQSSNVEFHWFSKQANDPELDLIKQDIEAAGYCDQIKLMDLELLEEHLPASKVFFLTDRANAFSTQAALAMGHGCAIILFSGACGNQPHIRDEGGMVIPIRDTFEAATKIKRLHDDRTLRNQFANRNREFVGNHLLPNTCVPRLLESTKNRALHQVAYAATTRQRNVILTSPSWQVSGVNTFTETLVRKLLERNFDASLLFTTKNPIRLLDTQLPDVPYRFLSNITLDETRRRETIYDYLKAQRNTVFIPNFDYVASSIANRLPDTIRTLGILHSDDDEHYVHAHRMINCWDRAVAVSQRIQQRLLQVAPAFAGTATVIRYGIELPAIDREALSSNRNQETLKILYTGRITQQQKRIFDFIRLAQELNARDVDFQITLVGDGEDLAELKRQVTASNLSHRIHLTGRQTSADIKCHLSSHHVFCLLSDYEGLPLSVLEAMAMECVPVTTQIESGISEILSHNKNALLAPLRDIPAVADNLQSLANNVLLRKELGTRARHSLFRHRLTADQMADSYAELLNQLHDDIENGKTRSIRLPIQCDSTERLLNAA